MAAGINPIFHYFLKKIFLSDINECLTGRAICGENTECVNNVGSYTCMCASGYDFIDGRCTGMSTNSSIKIPNKKISLKC